MRTWPDDTLLRGVTGTCSSAPSVERVLSAPWGSGQGTGGISATHD